MAARQLVLVLTVFTPLIVAYSNSFPLLTWSSHSLDALNSLPSSLTHPTSIIDSVLLSDQVCDHDSIILIDHPGLHASDLRNLPQDTYIARSLADSPFARQYPYVPIRFDFSWSSLADTLASKCQSRLLQYRPGDSEVSLDHGLKHVVKLQLPLLADYDVSRKSAMEQHEAVLGEELAALAKLFPLHLVIYAGTPIGGHSRRRLAHTNSVLNINHIIANSTIPAGGILKRYQVLTPGLITVLLFVFFVFVPVLSIGIRALASIQNPIKMDLPKSYNAQERKNQ